MNVKNLVYHGMFVLVLSSLLTGLVYAQGEAATTFPLGPMPKVIVFILTIVLSIVVDSLIMLGLVGGLRLKKAIIMAIPWAFLNIYWFDYIAPASGMTLMTLRFVPIGDPSWNYWIGINWIAVFLLDFLIAQGVFRFARGAAPSPNWQDAISAGIDTVLPAILFLVLPMVGLI
ncbi:MAG: hypothetical protein AYK18_02780 [Theionarchaea archaeon DG-70]|nr:MAG: hypothetical protein AYK18_02780 [Theionarchaea archaeon DG-70]